MDNKKLGFIVIVLVVVAVSGAIIIINMPSEDPRATIIDELFANTAKVLVAAGNGDGYFLSDEMTPIEGNNDYEQIGDVEGTKGTGGGFGFKIHWNGTIYHTPLYLSISLTFPAEEYFDESKYDYNVTFTVTISHNVTIEYNLGLVVSQLIFYPEPVIWGFERSGTISKTGEFTFDTTVLDNSSYRCVRDVGDGNIITPQLSILCPIEKDFYTEVIVTLARIDVISQT